MRLGRRLSTGVAEHPVAPAPVREPQPEKVEAEAPRPVEPVELAER